MKDAVTQRLELKAACLALLDASADEHPAGHQGKLAARYVLRAGGGERIGLMFEKSEKTKPNLWVEHRFSQELLDDRIETKLYPASSLYQADETRARPAYGRHAALKSMRELAHADLVRFTIVSVEQLALILSHLASRRLLD